MGRRWTVAGGAVLLAAGISCVVALGGSAAPDASAPASSPAALPPTSRPPPTTTTSTTTTTAPPRPATTRPATTATRRPTTTTTTTTPTTTTTIVPVVTHLADIAVLRPTVVAAPVHVAIPAVEVDAFVLPTGVDATGALDVPSDARTLVWYRFGPSPGAPGSAVIAGHLNWKGAEGTFADLAATPVGAEVLVAYDGGARQRFVVRSVELVDKPAVAVNGTFARDGERVLRLVTCGGEFDSSTRHYLSNVVVTAVPA